MAMSVNVKAPPRMSGSEVLGCVELITAALSEATELVGRLSRKQKKRKGERSFHEVLLYQVLEQGGKQISDAYDQGFRQLGSSFRLGDDQARERLLCVAIEINSDVVQTLQVACAADKAEVDLVRLHESAITSRHDAIRCLNDLRDRVQRVRPIGTPLPISHKSLAAGNDMASRAMRRPATSHALPPLPSLDKDQPPIPPQKSGLRRMLSTSTSSSASQHRRARSESPPSDVGSTLLPQISPVSSLGVDMHSLTHRSISPPTPPHDFQFPAPVENVSSAPERSMSMRAAQVPAPLILPAQRAMSLSTATSSCSASTDAARVMEQCPRPADMTAYDYYRTHIRQPSGDTVVLEATPEESVPAFEPVPKRRPSPISIAHLSPDDASVIEQLSNPRPAPPTPRSRSNSDSMTTDLRRFPTPPAAVSRFAVPPNELLGFPSPPPSITSPKLPAGTIPIASAAPHSARPVTTNGPGPLVPAPIPEVEDNGSVDGDDYDKASVYSLADQSDTSDHRRISAGSEGDDSGSDRAPVSPMSRSQSGGSFGDRSVSPISPITEYSPSSYGPHGGSGAYSYTYKSEASEPRAVSVRSGDTNGLGSASNSGRSMMQESVGMFEYGRYEDYDHWKAELSEKLREAKSKDVKKALQEESKERMRAFKEEEKLKLKALKDGEKERQKEEQARKREEREKLKAEKRAKKSVRPYVPLSAVAIGGGGSAYSVVQPMVHTTLPTSRPGTAAPTSPTSIKQFAAMRDTALPPPPKLNPDLTIRARSNTMASTWSKESDITSFSTTTNSATKKKGLFRFGPAAAAKKVTSKDNQPATPQIELGSAAMERAERESKLIYERYRKAALYSYPTLAV